MKPAPFIAALALAATATATAQENFGRQISRAEQTFDREAAVLLRPEYRRYEKELASLERDLVRSRDYKGAALVQLERLKIHNILARADAPPSTRPRKITLKLEDATVSGNTITWTPKIPPTPGGYRVTTEPSPVKLTVSEGFHTAQENGTLRIATGKQITVTLESGTSIEQLILTPVPRSPKEKVAPRMRRGARLLRVSPLALAIVAHSASAVSPELLKLQEGYKKKVAEVISPSAEQYREDLAAIATEYAKTGDYLSAARLAGRSGSISALVGSLKATRGADLVLPLEDASFVGPVTYDPTSGTVGRFTRENARATWELRQVVPGSYDITITYAVNHLDDDDRVTQQGTRSKYNAGGTFVIREETNLQRGESDETSITHSVENTGGWESFRTETIGTLSLASTSATIVLEALNPEPQGLMVLREIRFAPSAAPDRKEVGSSSASTQLAALTRSHQKRSAQLLAPIAAAYSAELGPIMNAANQAGDTKSADKAETVLRKLDKLSGSVTSSIIETAGPAITLSAVDELQVQIAGTTVANASRTHLTLVGPGDGGAVTWQLPTPPGDERFYQASLRHRPSPTSGGRISLSAGANLLSRYFTRPEKRESGGDQFQETVLGVISVPSDTAAVQLRVENLDPDSDSAFDLEALVLRPLEDPAAARTTITRQEREAESKRERSSTWKVVENCSLVETDGTAGSRFRIRLANGEEREASLYAVNSPRASYGDSEPEVKELNDLSSQLRLDKNDAERIGRKALKMLTEAIAEPGATVYTNGDTRTLNGTNVLAVLISSPAGTPLAVRLAEEGLAYESYWYGNSPLPPAVGSDISRGVFGRWVSAAIGRAKSSKKGIWTNRY